MRHSIHERYVTAANGANESSAVLDEAGLGKDTLPLVVSNVRAHLTHEVFYFVAFLPQRRPLARGRETSL